MKLLAGSSNLPFAQSLSRQLNLPLGAVELSKFPNGEQRIRITETIKGDNVILVQSLSEPTDQNVMETLLLIDALERLGARHVNLVIPWLGYSLQDKSFRDGEPIAAKVIADLISNSYVKRVFLLELHNSSIPGFFAIPSHHLSSLQLFHQYVREQLPQHDNYIVASPDFGGLKRARLFADSLGLGLANVDKHRDLHTGQVEALGVSGDVTGKDVLVFDDVINGGSTVASCAEILKQHGAKSVSFLATHGPLVASGHELITNSAVDRVVITNSIHHAHTSPKIVTLDAAGIFAEELKSWYTTGQ